MIGRRFFTMRALVPLLALVLAGCVAPPYDSRTDDLVSSLQTEVDAKIVSLITLDRQIAELQTRSDPDSIKALAEAKKKASYDANVEFYDKVDVDLMSLSLRLDASVTDESRQKLDVTISSIHDNLLEADGSMQLAHRKQVILPERDLKPRRLQFKALFGAVLTYELVRKNGAPK